MRHFQPDRRPVIDDLGDGQPILPHNEAGDRVRLVNQQGFNSFLRIIQCHGFCARRDQEEPRHRRRSGKSSPGASESILTWGSSARPSAIHRSVHPGSGWRLPSWPPRSARRTGLSHPAWWRRREWQAIPCRGSRSRCDRKVSSARSTDWRRSWEDARTWSAGQQSRAFMQLVSFGSECLRLALCVCHQSP